MKAGTSAQAGSTLELEGKDGPKERERRHHRPLQGSFIETRGREKEECAIAKGLEIHRFALFETCMLIKRHKAALTFRFPSQTFSPSIIEQLTDQDPNCK